MAQPESSDVKGNVFIQALRSFCSDHHADDALFHAETQEPRNTLYFGAIFDWMVTLFIIHTYPHIWRGIITTTVTVVLPQLPIAVKLPKGAHLYYYCYTVCFTS